MHVLAIEDNPRFLELMRSHLTTRGFTVNTAETLADGMVMAAASCYDVVLLDLSLPDGDGKEFIDWIRHERGSMPIIVLSARSEIADRLDSLDMGADDYLVKPFDFDELVARMHAVARRGTLRNNGTLVFGDVEFDQRRRQVLVNGQIVTLRPRETALLELLLRHAGEPIHRDMLYSLDEEIGSNVLDVHVHHLRRRLAEAGARVSIATVRGHGYALRGDEA
jgi:two-component system, OmpR family, response regulator QseB